MNADDHRWAVIFPAGDGRHPASRDSRGRIIPTQYCSSNGGDALIRGAIRRARTVVAQERICVVVERDHRRHWWSLGSIIPAANLLVQPHDRGTAMAILFAVLEILDRDPFAQMLFVPADHYFGNERALCIAMNRALGRIASSGLELTLIAAQAEYPASDLAYIVPGARVQEDMYRVREFRGNPPASLAQQLCEHGSYWSTSLFCAWGFCVLALLREYLPAIVDDMSTTLARAADRPRRIDALAELYGRLPNVDFARTVMCKSRSMMHVVHARNCGWTDLGTPQQVQRAVRRFKVERPTETGQLHASTGTDASPSLT